MKKAWNYLAAIGGLAMLGLLSVGIMEAWMAAARTGFSALPGL